MNQCRCLDSTGAQRRAPGDHPRFAIHGRYAGLLPFGKEADARIPSTHLYITQRRKKQTHHHGGDPVRIDWQALFITLSSLRRLHKRLWRRLRRRVPGMRSLLYGVLPRPDGLLSDHWPSGLFAVFPLPFLDGRFEYTAGHLGHFLTTGMWSIRLVVGQRILLPIAHGRGIVRRHAHPRGSEQ
jgi:hypothetical protein